MRFLAGSRSATDISTELVMSDIALRFSGDVRFFGRRASCSILCKASMINAGSFKDRYFSVIMSGEMCDLYGSSNFRKYEGVIVAEYCMMDFLSVVGENKNAWEGLEPRH